MPGGGGGGGNLILDLLTKAPITENHAAFSCF